MATIALVQTRLSRDRARELISVLWETLTNGDTGGPADETDGMAFMYRKSVQITGTFGSGGTVVIEGSDDGTNYETLNDLQDGALSITAAGLYEVQEHTRYIRPDVTAGDGTTDLDVTLVGMR